MKYLSFVTLWVLFNISSFAQLEVPFSSIPKEGTVLIFSHMDDDMIWMLPWWSKSEKFIGGAVPSAPVYETIVSKQQEYLDANGYNIDYESNWLNPWGKVTIEEYDSYYWGRDAAYSYMANEFLLCDWDDDNSVTVRTEVNRIKSKLEQYIANPEVSRIITHNNWGEYGHQHHRALNKAIRELAVKYRKDVWMLGCTYNPTDRLVDVPLPLGITFTRGDFNDAQLYNSIKDIYNNYWHWTFGPYDDLYVPSGYHPFIKIVDNGIDWSGILAALPPPYNFDNTITAPGPEQSRTGAYILDGIDDYISLANNQNSTFSYAMWVRPDEINYGMDIFRLTEYPSSELFDRNLVLNSNGQVMAYLNDGAQKTVASTTLLSAGNWTHIAVTSDGTSFNIYINGILENTVFAGASAETFSTPEFVLGQAMLTPNFFKGQLSDIKLFDYSLSASEIASLAGPNPPPNFTISANAGIGGSITPSGETTVLGGTSVTYSISSEPYYTINDVTIDGVSQVIANSYTFSNVSDNHTIAVNFGSQTGNIALKKATACSSFLGQPCYMAWDDSHANDEDGSNSSTWVAEGTFPHWWRVDLGEIYDISYIVVRNRVSDPNFIAQDYYRYEIWAFTNEQDSTLIVQKSDNNPATDEGDRYPVAATARYLKVYITYSSNNSATISDFRVYGVLNPNFIKINSVAKTWGTIIPAGDLNYSVGTNVTYSIIPDFGYEISDVMVDGASVGAVSEYTFTGVGADHIIEAKFTSTMQNIALGKTATAESFQDQDDWWGPSKAIDEDGSNASCWATNVADQWWKIDLGAIYDISYLVIRGYVDTNCNPRYYHYNINSSLDDEEYTQIAEKTNNNIVTDKGDVYIISIRTRYLLVNMISSSYDTGVQISDFRVYGSRTPGLWTGGISSDWNNSANWNDGTIPTSDDDVVIMNAPNDPICNDLTIGSMGSLTIKPGGALTISGTLTNSGTLNLESDANGIASLIVGTYTRETGGTENIEMYLTGGGVEPNYTWHYISSPVSSLSTDVFTTGANPSQNLAAYIESHSSTDLNQRWNAWDGWDYSIGGYPETPITFNNLEVGSGYNYYYYNTIKRTFGGVENGSLNTGQVTKNLSYTGETVNLATQGWNLLGNPYTASINWDDISRSETGVDNAIYFTNEGGFCSYVDGVGVPSGTTGTIPPMQGFFVKANQENCNITFSPDNRIHSNVNRYKARTIIPLIRLKIENQNANDETVIRFNNKATATFDSEFDAYKFNKSSSVSLWTSIGQVSYSINSIPLPESETEVPLAMKTSKSGSSILTVTELQGLEDYNIYLLDKLLGTTTNLRTNPTINFSASKEMLADRFLVKIVFNPKENPVTQGSIFNVYFSKDFVNIQTLSDMWDGLSGSVDLIDLSGKTIWKIENIEFWKNSLIQIPATGYQGLLFVKMQSGLMRHVEKVMIVR